MPSSRGWVSSLVVVLTMLVGVLLGPQCADDMTLSHPLDQQLVLAMEPVGLGPAMPMDDGPRDLGGVLALCVTVLVGVLLAVVRLRPGSGRTMAPARRSRTVGGPPATPARAPGLERLCVRRT